jgi:ArsR family transcriptional regulator
MRGTELPLRTRGVCCQLPLSDDRRWAEDKAALLRALADPTRLSMVAALSKAEQPVCICDFTAAFDLSQATISHHMARLRDAGLVESEKRGIWIYYRLSDSLSASTRRLLEALTA